MTILSKTAKLYLKGKDTFISALVEYAAVMLVLIINVYSIYNGEGGSNQPYFVLIYTYYSNLIIILFSLIKSVLFFRKGKRSNLDEVLGKSAYKINLAKFIVLFINLIILAISIGVTEGLAMKALGATNSMYGYLLMKVLVEIVLVGLTLIFVGFALSQIPNVFASYGLCLVMIYLASNASRISVFEARQKMGFLPFMELFSLMTPQNVEGYSLLYGMQVESTRVYGMLFVIALCALTIIIVKYFANIKKLMVFALSIACIMILFALKAINIGSMYRPLSATLAECYCSDEEDAKLDQDEARTNKGFNVEPTDYRVTAYNMKFHIDNELTASVNMRIENRGVPDEYVFGLFGGYEISSLTGSAGEKLDYTKEGNVIKIHNSSGKNIDEITIKYHGKSYRCWTNSKSVFLPGYFSYYPRPVDLEKTEDFSCGAYLDCNKADYDVMIDGVKTYSNLRETGGHFVGNSANVFFLGGECEKRSVEGHDYIVPTLLVDKKYSALKAFSDVDEMKAKQNADDKLTEKLQANRSNKMIVDRSLFVEDIKNGDPRFNAYESYDYIVY